MNKKQKSRLLRLLSLSCIIVFCSSTIFVHADDIDKLKQQTSNLENQLNDLNSELSSLSSEILNLSSQIANTTAAIEKAELDITAAKLNEDIQYTAMKKRIKFMYETGNPSFLAMLCSSESMAEFLNRTEFVKSITQYDRDMLTELKEIRLDIEEKESALIEEQASLTAMQESMSSKAERLNSLIASTSSELVASAQALADAQAAQNAASGSTGSFGSTSTTTPSTGTSNDDLVLFAALLQCEAGSTNYNALLAVATVVMNRVNSSNFPNTLYGVIYQRGQFSPTWNGSLSRTLAKGPASLCYQVARDALNGSRLAAVQSCYYFNASYTGKPGIIVGGNVFW